MFATPGRAAYAVVVVPVVTPEEALALVESAPRAVLGLTMPLCSACMLLPASLDEVHRVRPDVTVAIAEFASPVDWAARERLLWPRPLGLRLSCRHRRRALHGPVPPLLDAKQSIDGLKLRLQVLHSIVVLGLELLDIFIELGLRRADLLIKPVRPLLQVVTDIAHGLSPCPRSRPSNERAGRLVPPGACAIRIWRSDRPERRLAG